MKRRYNSGKTSNKFSDSSDDSHLSAYLIICIIIILISGGTYLYYNDSQVKKHIDQNFCSIDHMSAMTVILIDHTDTLNAIQRTSLETRLWDVAKSIPKNSMIKVYAVGNTISDPLKPVLEACNPGDRDSVNDYTGNTKLAAQKYELKFKDPIMKSFRDVVSDRPDSESPIMESLQSVAVTSFIGENNKIAKKSLILVSDLLQHSDGFTVYKGLPEFEAFKKSAFWKTSKADFTDVEVKVYFLNRRSNASLQNAQLLKFWTIYFDSQGARLTNVIPVEG